MGCDTPDRLLDRVGRRLEALRCRRERSRGALDVPAAAPCPVVLHSRAHAAEPAVGPGFASTRAGVPASRRRRACAPTPIPAVGPARGPTLGPGLGSAGGTRAAKDQSPAPTLHLLIETRTTGPDGVSRRAGSLPCARIRSLEGARAQGKAAATRGRSNSHEGTASYAYGVGLGRLGARVETERRAR